MKLTQLAIIVMLAGVIRSGCLEAAGHKILILGKVNRSEPLQDVSFMALSGSVAGLSRDNEATTESSMNETSGESGGWSRWIGALSELAGMLITTAVSITLASFWKNKHSVSKQGMEFGVVLENGAHHGAEDAQKTPETVLESQASQAELDWVDSARNGMLRLTDDVYCAAIQWWLEQPLTSIVDRIGPKDQALMKPVADLMELGRDKEANNLLEQIGRLDRMEREHQKISRTSSQPVRPSSPLQRSSPDMKTSTAQLRKSVASYRVAPKANNSGARDFPLGPREAGFENGRRSPQALETPTMWHQPFENTLAPMDQQNEFLESSPFFGECWRGCGA